MAIVILGSLAQRFANSTLSGGEVGRLMRAGSGRSGTNIPTVANKKLFQKMLSKVSEEWLRIMAVTLVGSFAMESFGFLYIVAFVPYRVSELVPWTYASFWLLAALAGSAYLLKNLKIDPQKYLYGLFFGCMLASIFLIFIPVDKWFITYRYSGVETRISNDTHTEGRFDELVVSDFPVTLGSLYEKSSLSLQRDLAESRRYNEYVSNREFIFWQTGLAYGYNPTFVGHYSGGDGFLNRIELIITAGPIVLIECFIKGFFKFFIFLICFQIFWYRKFKSHYLVFTKEE